LATNRHFAQERRKKKTRGPCPDKKLGGTRRFEITGEEKITGIGDIIRTVSEVIERRNARGMIKVKDREPAVPRIGGRGYMRQKMNDIGDIFNVLPEKK